MTSGLDGRASAELVQKLLGRKLVVGDNHNGGDHPSLKSPRFYSNVTFSLLPAHH